MTELHTGHTSGGASSVPAAKRACTDLTPFERCEEAVDAATGPYDVALLLGQARGLLLSEKPERAPQAKRADCTALFLAVVRKAGAFFSADLVLEVLALVDAWYGHSRCRQLDLPVHLYLLKVVSTPTPDGIRRLVKRIVSDRSNRYDNVFFEAVGGPTIGDANTWLKLEPSVEDETKQAVAWIDGRCSDLDLPKAKARVEGLFKEQRDDDVKVGHEDFDTDSIMVTERVTVDLNCPLSTTRIVIPATGKDSKTLQPFDLEHFLAVSIQRRRSHLEDWPDRTPPPWKSPITGEVLSRDTIIIDPYFTDILGKVPPDVRFVTIFKDGSWEAVAPKMADASNAQEAVQYIDVEDTPFDTKYDVVVKTESL